MKNLLGLLLLSFLLLNCNQKQAVKTITTLELKALLAKEKIQLLDVRSPKEVSDGFIETALFANYFDADFAAQAVEQLDSSKPVYLYCRSGNRSGKSAMILKEKGFEVYNVLGGFKMWSK
jgi:rhodanese-related sulfurtransferase